jgi:hypothetical protein
MRYIDILRAHEQHLLEKNHGGASAEQEDEFHTKLDKLVHKTFGHSSDEKKKADEAALAVHGEANLVQMVKTIFDDWNSKKHSNEEIQELLSAMGYRIKFDGDRAEMIKEAPGDIRKAIAGIALIASLWGVNTNLAHQAYDNSPQLQKLISLHQEAQAAGDEAAAENYADRIEQHKLRLDLGKGEVMGKDGRPKEVEPFEESYDDDDAFFEAFGWIEESLEEAEYQGRKVKLNKPMQGDVKKFKVYVKDPKTGNVKKVNFGHGGSSVKGKAMKIRKNNPKARKSFRARHNCDNPGPKTKARYWSCRKW